MKIMKVIVFVIVMCCTWGCMAKPLFVGPIDCVRCFSEILPGGAVIVRADMVPVLNDWHKKLWSYKLLVGAEVDPYFEYHLPDSSAYQNYLESRKLEKSYKWKQTKRNIVFGSVGFGLGLVPVVSAVSSSGNENRAAAYVFGAGVVASGLILSLFAKSLIFWKQDRIEKKKFKGLKIESLKQFNEEMSEIEREKVIFRQGN